MAKKLPPLSFIHLRVHSAYSLLEGALPIEKLVKFALRENMPAIGISDSNNLFGALEFSEKCAGKGVQPIIGCTIAVRMPEAEGDKEKSPALVQSAAPPQPDGEIALIAQNKTGYLNLLALTSAAFLETVGEVAPYITFEKLTAHAEGIICLTGGEDGPLDKAITNNHSAEAGRRARQLAGLFGDRLYIELQRHGRKSEKQREAALLDIAYDMNIPVVATNEAYFEKRGDYEAHDALVCVAEGNYVSEDDRRRLTAEHYLKPMAEMAALFADLPEALANTIEIARRCSYRPKTHAPILPNFLSDQADINEEQRLKAEADALRDLAEKGLKARLDQIELAPGKTPEDYATRLEYELDIIISMKFPGYFLIVADFIKWAKDQDIPVGPGRGSGAGSVVAWSLTITDLDPLRWGLLFERFLNPERISMPDFDIDFCQERRDEVIRYVQQKYGRDHVAQIITFGKLQARAVLRHVGPRSRDAVRLRRQNLQNGAQQSSEPSVLGRCDQHGRGASLTDPERPGRPGNGRYRAQARRAVPPRFDPRGRCRDRRPAAGKTDPALSRSAFRHAGNGLQHEVRGIRRSGEIRLFGPENAQCAEQARKLRQSTMAAVNGKSSIWTIPLDNRKAASKSSAAGETVGVFQLESSGMRDSLKKLKPDRFEDIIAMVALYRPGPMDNIPTYIARKQGDEKPDYYHDMLKPILEETYGVIIYQEQVMQIAQVMAGYSLGEADMLRRAMGKKIKEEMAKQKARFVDGALKNDVKKADAEFIFEQVDKFAGYGFNKSHAAAYALLAYQTAYLKANHPVEFLAATMTLDLGNTDKLNMFAGEARRMGLDTLPPDVNASGIDFRPKDKTILYSMAALKNIGSSAVASIVTEREENGPFKSLSDFAGRIDAKALGKRSLETLASAGAFDKIEPDRAKVFANAERIIGMASKLNNDRISGQTDLFGGESGNGPELELVSATRWREMEKLTREFDAVGFYLSGHPLDEYQTVLERLNVQTWVEYHHKAIDNLGGLGVLAATVSAVQERRSKSGNLYAFVEFSDQSGNFEAIAFSDTLNAYREVLASGQPVLIKVDADVEEDNVRLRLQKAESLEFAAQNMLRGLKLTVASNVNLATLAAQLEEGQGRGKIRVGIQLDEFDREVEISLAGKYAVSLERASDLRTLPGILAVEEI